MTISRANSSPVQNAGNGTAVTYAYPWKIFASTDLIVGFIVGGIYTQQTSGYTVAGIGVEGGGSITFSIAPPLGTTVDLRPLTPETQPTEFANLAAYLPENTTNATDRLTRALQDQTRLGYTFSIHALDQEIAPWTPIPGPTARANLALLFDSFGQPTVGTPTTQTLTTTLLATILGLLGYPANVISFGADPTGVVDSTSKIQNACNTGLPVYFPAGTYKVSSMIVLTTPYQRLYGDGLQSVILAIPSFNTAQQGMFNFTAGTQDNGPWFENLCFKADQSVVATSGTRANLTQYPACLFLRNAPRFRVINCRIDGFLIGIDAQGLSAGFVLESLDCATYTLGVVINGNGDTIRFKDFHYFGPNYWTSNQIAIWEDGNNIALATGRNDGMDISDSLFLGPGTAIDSFVSTGVNYPGTFAGSGFLTGVTNAQIVNSGFDTAATIVQRAPGSFINISNSYFSNGNATNRYGVNLTAGTVTITGAFAQTNVPPGVPIFYINNASGSTVHFSMNGTTINAPAGLTTPIVQAQGTAPVTVSIQNCVPLIAPGVTTGPMFQSVGANVQMIFQDNLFAPTAQTGNIALSIDTDNQHVITDNAFGGWSIQCPPVAGIASASQTVANPGVFTTAVQTWAAGQAVIINGAAAPGGFTLNTVYYVISGGLSSTTVELAATPTGTGIQCTGSVACTLVPLNATTFTQATLSNNSKRGTLNFNNKNIQPLQGTSGSASTVAATSTVYLGAGGTQASAPQLIAFQMPVSGNIVGFQVYASTGAGAGQTFTYTVYKNGSATGMTGQSTGANGNAAASTNAFPVALNDRVELQLVTSASANAGYHLFSILYEPA